MTLTNPQLITVSILLVLALAYMLYLSFLISYAKHFQYFTYGKECYRRHLTKGYYQVQQEHCLGKNPPDYVYTWQNCEDPKFYAREKATVIDNAKVDDEWVYYSQYPSDDPKYRYNAILNRHEYRIDNVCPPTSGWIRIDKPHWRV